LLTLVTYPLVPPKTLDQSRQKSLKRFDAKAVWMAVLVKTFNRSRVENQAGRAADGG
jgi:hypothetical protein